MKTFSFSSLVLVLFAFFASAVFIAVVPSFASPDLEGFVGIEGEVVDTSSSDLNLKASVEDPFGVGGAKIDAAADNTDLQSSLIAMLNKVLLFLGLFLLFIVIYAGFLIINSDGDEANVTKGRKMIIYAVIGVIVIILSYTIVNWIGTIGNDLSPATT